METKSKLPHSFDANDWVEEFNETVNKNPYIPFDKECMRTWFANALMAGWDEHSKGEVSVIEHVPIKKSRLTARWTWEGHFAYDYFNNKDPQLCITASGWKAKVLGILFRARD